MSRSFWRFGSRLASWPKKYRHKDIPRPSNSQLPLNYFCCAWFDVLRPSGFLVRAKQVSWPRSRQASRQVGRQAIKTASKVCLQRSVLNWIAQLKYNYGLRRVPPLALDSTDPIRRHLVLVKVLRGRVPKSCGPERGQFSFFGQHCCFQDPP